MIEVSKGIHWPMVRIDVVHTLSNKRLKLLSREIESRIAKCEISMRSTVSFVGILSFRVGYDKVLMVQNKIGFGAQFTLFWLH